MHRNIHARIHIYAHSSVYTARQPASQADRQTEMNNNAYIPTYTHAYAYTFFITYRVFTRSSSCARTAQNVNHLGGSWVVISELISRVTIVITHILRDLKLHL